MTASKTLRLLIADVDPERQVLTDAQVTDFLALNGVEGDAGDSWAIRRAAADALDAIATSEVLVGKVIRTQDLSTDGVKVAAELRAQAERLRQRADDDEDNATGGGGLSVVEFEPWR